MASPPPPDNPSVALLSRVHSPGSVSRIHSEKVSKKPLLLRPTEPDASNARGRRQRAALDRSRNARKSNKPRPLSAKQKRALCLYEIPKERRKWSLYVGLHKMWCAYMREILGDGAYMTAAAAGPKLTSADFHGAMIEVVRSRCVGRVGVKGIVVQDTKFTFVVVTQADEIKTIPKEHTIFRFELPLERDNAEKPLVFELHGSQFENRAPDRANKKFKQHFSPDL
ncbi:hypothetical protein IWX90DRAFT_389159 [Phyllosticta citrichinensis]|uniref:Ribonuclease P protein subunit n=1 Tax=Phyllosticta citrichinensis TaxID=1130410 RepID=A0ABR1XP89_9PEZI